MDNKINGKTPEEIKKGLEYSKTKYCIHKSCPYWAYDEVAGNCMEQSRIDALTYIQQLESELEPLRKAKEENRLIILPYAPGTVVYAFDDIYREAVPTKYTVSMYGQRCALTKEEFYERLNKDYGFKRKDC